MGICVYAFDGMKRKIGLILCLLCRMSMLYSQESKDYFNDRYLRTSNFVYSPTIRSVQCERKGEEMSDAVIRLASPDKIVLRFDDLTDDSKDYQYRIIHCDATWHPSVLSENDFIGGFYTDHITTYHHSLATVQPYMHYELEFPNEQMEPIISGNYLLAVFDQSEPDSLVLIQRFQVYENGVDIAANIHRASAIYQHDTHQEVDFTLHTERIRPTDPYNEIKVTIVQNNNYATAITQLKPMFILNDELQYNYDEGNVFEGGNEYRNFDLRSTRFQSLYVDHIEKDPSTLHWEAWLKPAERRGYQRYSQESDLDGHYSVKVYEGRDGQLEGDYVKMHFRLPVIEESDSGSIYIFGELTNWNLEPAARMVYNPENRSYEQSLIVKQGYYNYLYLFVPSDGSAVRVADTEGNHWETENQYTISIYQRAIGSRYDKLVGYKRLFSGKNN